VTSRVLEVAGLTTVLKTAEGEMRPVNDVSFHVDRGEILGLVGESGCGKSMTALSLIGQIDAPLASLSGRVVLNGQDLMLLSSHARRKLCGDRLAMVFQDPMSSLNPVLTIQTQLVETVLAHRHVSRARAKARALEVLQTVGIADAKKRLDAYPHEFSGGMRQRVAIAIALLNQPELIVCDEPTTALDVSIQGQILAEMQRLCSETGTALIWITHDLSLVAGLADRVAVMYAGQIVETGTTLEVLEAPRHRYTEGLIASTPAKFLGASRSRGARLKPIAGAPPSLARLPSGCPFHPRCAHAVARCQSPLEETREASGRTFRCVNPGPGANP